MAHKTPGQAPSRCLTFFLSGHRKPSCTRWAPMPPNSASSEISACGSAARRPCRRPASSAPIVVVDAGRILLHRRQHNDMLPLPGGKISKLGPWPPTADQAWAFVRGTGQSWIRGLPRTDGSARTPTRPALPPRERPPARTPGLRHLPGNRPPRARERPRRSPPAGLRPAQPTTTASEGAPPQPLMPEAGPRWPRAETTLQRSYLDGTPAFAPPCAICESGACTHPKARRHSVRRRRSANFNGFGGSSPSQRTKQTNVDCRTLRYRTWGPGH